MQQEQSKKLYELPYYKKGYSYIKYDYLPEHIKGDYLIHLDLFTGRISDRDINNHYEVYPRDKQLSLLPYRFYFTSSTIVENLVADFKDNSWEIQHKHYTSFIMDKIDIPEEILEEVQYNQLLKQLA